MGVHSREAGALGAPKARLREGRPLRASAEGSGYDVNKCQVAAGSSLTVTGKRVTAPAHSRRQRGIRWSQPGGVGGGEAPAKIWREPASRIFGPTVIHSPTGLPASLAVTGDTVWGRGSREGQILHQAKGPNTVIPAPRRNTHQSAEQMAQQKGLKQRDR